MLCYMYIDTGAGAWTRRVAIHARPMQGKKRRAGKMGSPFLSIRDLGAWYGGGKTVLSGFSLELAEREVAGPFFKGQCRQYAESVHASF
ncbi:MAG: hypothetical protein HFH23_14585 [Ruminococcus sp.]|nr:hypothetical protein [Ruminococcus sp.]